MSVVVVGSVALDTIHTPTEMHADLLGGSAFYFSLAARHFTPVGVVAVVGDDFPAEHVELLTAREIDLSGFERAPGRTFRWEGRYEADPNKRTTLRTELGVFETFHPRLPEPYIGADALFLANIDPKLQLEVLAGAGEIPLVAVDTMNFWIDGQPETVREVIARAHVLLVNDEEAEMLTHRSNPAEAAEEILTMGPEVVVVKKGAHGAAARGPWGWRLFPSYPVLRVQDPTGAGDTFAGGLVGYLAGKDWRDPDRFSEGLALATSIASLVVEEFGVAGIAQPRPDDLKARCRELREAMRFNVPLDL